MLSKTKKKTTPFTMFVSCILGGLLAFIVFPIVSTNESDTSNEDKIIEQNIFNFFDKHFEVADVYSKQYNIPISLMLSLALVENENGTNINEVFFKGFDNRFKEFELVFLRDCLENRCLTFELNEIGYFDSQKTKEQFEFAISKCGSYMQKSRNTI